MTSLQVRPSTTIYGLVITWGPPSGSNYTTPVTYQVRYRERPSSGPPGSWSSTVVRSAREYTTPTLKPGTRYEVEVWAVFGNVEGIRLTKNGTTHAIDGRTLHVLYVHISLYMYCTVLSSLAHNITLQASAVTTSSITVIPSGPSGEVSYEETGSSDGPTNVPYSSSITISNLKPNTWYTITYIFENSLGMEMTNVTKLTLPEGELLHIYCVQNTIFIIIVSLQSKIIYDIFSIS